MKHTTYPLHVAGLVRDLPICRVNDNLYIGAFVIFGDVELTECCARDLLKVAPEHDIIITAESKGIPLAYEMAKQSGNNRYLIARKIPKLYMKNVFTVKVNSITTAKEQTLCIDEEDANFMKGKRVLIWTMSSPPVNPSTPWNSWWKKPAATSWAKWPSWPKATLKNAPTSFILKNSPSSIPTAP